MPETDFEYHLSIHFSSVSVFNGHAIFYYNDRKIEEREIEGRTPIEIYFLVDQNQQNQQLKISTKHGQAVIDLVEHPEEKRSEVPFSGGGSLEYVIRKSEIERFGELYQTPKTTDKSIFLKDCSNCFLI